METIWLKLKDAEKLGMPLRTLNYKCANNLYACRKVPSRGKKGFTYEISIESLPEKFRNMYWQEHIPQNQSDSVNTSSPTQPENDPEVTEDIIAKMTAWEREYVQHFLILYETTKTLKGGDLKFFLGNWANAHPGYGWAYQSYMQIKKKYEESGKSVEAIRPKWGKRESSVPDEWGELYDREYLTQRQPSSISCWKNVIGALRRKDPSIDISTVPSHSSFYRKMCTKYSESMIFYMRNGMAKWKVKYGYHISRHCDDILCGEVWVSDHVQSDVTVSTADGRTHFLWITVWVDVKSRKWLGWDIHIESPKSEHIFKAFYNAAKKWGIPSDVIIDNGKDYRCKALSGGRIVKSYCKVKVDEFETLSLFTELSIAVHFAWPYNPETKICERTFSTINSGFSRHCIGYRGPDITQRPDTLKKESRSNNIWDFGQFVTAFNEYIEKGYNLDISNGKTLQGRCPDELFNSEWPQAINNQAVHLVSSESLKMFCSPLSEPVRVSKAVVYDKKYDIRYYAPWMQSKNGSYVRFRRDESDYGVAYFWDAQSGEYLAPAEIDGNVSMLARSPLEKEKLEDHIRRKRDTERAIKQAAKAIAGTDNDEFIKNRIAGIAALNEARGFKAESPKVKENYLITSMDKVVAENRRKKNEQYDFASEADMSIKSDPLADIDLYGTKAVNL
jgi:putative transposase